MWCGVKAYDPRLAKMAVGVYHGIPSDISEKQLLDALGSNNAIVRVRRLRQSGSLTFSFGSLTLPAVVTLGYVLYKTHPYVEYPTQCKICGRLGPVSATRRSPLPRVGCGKKHETKGTTPEPHCVNYISKSTSSSHYCFKWREEKSMAKYRQLNHVVYPTARAAPQGIFRIYSTKTYAGCTSDTYSKQWCNGTPPDLDEATSTAPSWHTYIYTISEPSRTPATKRHPDTENPKRTSRASEKQLNQQQSSCLRLVLQLIDTLYPFLQWFFS